MISNRHTLCLALVSLAAFSTLDARLGSKKRAAQQQSPEQQQCAQQKDCYCSEKGDFRPRKTGDKPVYVENDPKGKYCYCNDWDRINSPGPVARPQPKKKGWKKAKKQTAAPVEEISMSEMTLEAEPGATAKPVVQPETTKKRSFRDWFRRRSVVTTEPVVQPETTVVQ